MAFFPGNAAARGVQYGAELRWGDSLRRAAQIPGTTDRTPVDLTTVQLELLVPAPLETFVSPHIGWSWGNYGVPAVVDASRAWSFDFGVAFSGIVISALPYASHAQSLFNLEVGVDVVAAVSSMRTQSAAGGVIDIQSDFLLDFRPLVRFVFFVDRRWSVYLGAEVSMFDFTGSDDVIHGHMRDTMGNVLDPIPSRRASQFMFGVQFNPGGRTVAAAH